MDAVDSGLRYVFRRLINGHERWPLYLFGKPGRGKTCASLALLDHIPWTMARRDFPFVSYIIGGRYWVAEELINYLLNHEWDTRIKDCSLAVLDELGERIKNTDLHYTAVKRFADDRIHKPTIYISNLHPDEIAKAYDDRIASRILCGTCYELTGDDRRMTGI